MVAKRKVRAEPTPDDTPEVGGLDARREAVALLLAGGSTQTRAAREVKVGVASVKRWCREPEFARRVRELRSAMVDRALGKLADSMSYAAHTLVELCVPGVQESVRLGAARSVLELGVKLRESSEFEARISALEAGGQPR